VCFDASAERDAVSQQLAIIFLSVYTSFVLAYLYPAMSISVDHVITANS